jgi:CheY-like chemotaxis protein
MSTHKSTILLVEDDSLIALYLEDLLIEWGLSVLGPVVSADEAEVIAAHGVFDFALLDVNLVGGTSYRAAEALEVRGLPFAFVTAYGAQGVREDLRALAVLAKPVNERALRTILGAAGVLHPQGL